ncbi:uncharacterized protein PV09_03640 [Verruconis gallopava]|uniref:Uncharacterized protein n=1 Tax=Verruconis gallopava TaxID=253628 RepID=A0A0D2AGT1_9PEZI|nr:uncharacterized protein PV09_03640 [Verruconis gallopava]KIW05785.1 hypothetical protein PV09_03640 [Verruconis gallopava]
MSSTPKGGSASKNTPPLRPVKPTSSKVASKDARLRSISAPPLNLPLISIEDVTQPLTYAESSHAGTPPHSKPPTRHVTDEWSGAGRVVGQDEYRKPSRESVNPSRSHSSAWKHHKRSPNVGWKKRWDMHHDPFRDGRVLIVDCYSREFSDDGKRKTEAYELASINELKEFYGSKKGKGDGQCLRIVHVQNAIWARDFLLKKFNISSKVEDVVGTSFGKWVQFDKPQLRAGKPVLNAKSFRCIKDPWRGVSRTGFVVDYLKSFKPGVIKDSATQGFKLMGLNHWDQETGTTIEHGYDVYVQRLSVYIQRNEGKIDLHPFDTELRNPYIDLAFETVQQRARKERSIQMVDSTNINARSDFDHDFDSAIPKMANMHVPNDWEAKVFEKLTELDNGNTIIVFESSHTGNLGDTLIQAREEIEVRWRRLMLYLNKEEQTEDRLAMECMDLVLRDIFAGLRIRWEKTLNKCEAHVSILEDKIYENPADESRAPELWSNSALWLKLEKLISLHIVTINDLQQQMRDLSESEDFVKDDWLKDTPSDLTRVATLFDEEMVKPTTNLSDLLYKSVGIRDSRHSLQLGTSMWRLSWITFIFLPLTFMVGFFGMNVDVFQPGNGHFPSLKWYFVASIPLMIIIILLYMFIKSAISTSISHDLPMQRGVYEQIYNEFAEAHPRLWSRAGPRTFVQPTGIIVRLKWSLIKRWFHPSSTIARESYTKIDELGLWARIKRSVAMHWLTDIEAASGIGMDEELGTDGEGEFSTVRELLQTSMPIAMAEAWPGIGDPPSTPPLLERILSRRSRSSSGSRSSVCRISSPGSAMVIEEEKNDEEITGAKTSIVEGKMTTANVEPSAMVGTSAHAEKSTMGDSSHASSGLLDVPFTVKRSFERAPEKAGTQVKPTY